MPRRNPKRWELSNIREDMNKLKFRLNEIELNLEQNKPHCPYRFKYELVDWLTKTRKYTKSQANKLTKKQLYAIWYKS